MKFYGEDAGDPVSYKTAADAIAAGDVDKIYIEAKPGNTITLVQVNGVENKDCIASDKKSAAIAAEADVDTAEIKLIVTVTNGEAQKAFSYTLQVSAQVDNKSNLTVTAVAPVNVWVSDVANDSIEIGVTGMRTIQDVINALSVVYTADNSDRGETQGESAGTVEYAGEGSLTSIVNVGDTIALKVINNDGTEYEITAEVRTATAEEAADAAIASAKQALEGAIDTGIELQMDDADAAPDESDLKTAIAEKVQEIVGDPDDSGVTVEAADVSITGVETLALAENLAAVEVGAEATVSFTVSLEDTEAAGTAVDVDGTLTYVWYLDDDGAKGAVSAVISAINDWAFDTYGDWNTFEAALVSALEDIPGVQANSVSLTRVGDYPAAAGAVKFTYSFKYGPDTTVDAIEIETETTITLV